MATDRAAGSAIAFRCSSSAYRPAVQLLPPSTDAGSPPADGLWSDCVADSRPARHGTFPANLATPPRRAPRTTRHAADLQSDSTGQHTPAAITALLSSAHSPQTSRRHHRTPVFELAAAETGQVADGRPSFGALLVRRPSAALALIPRPAVLFLAGAVAGAIGKTLTAPLDRVKILLQVKGGLECEGVRAAAASGGVWNSLVAIGKAEGIKGYWRGNLPQVLRVIPYSAAQLYSYEIFKRCFADARGELPVQRRLAAGACAGMASTLLTYPLDTLRLRLAVDPSLRGVRAATAALMREGGSPAFFRGLGIALIGIAPYMALELAAFDLLPRDLPAFARGFSAALIATSFCYPLDTIRRQIQLQSTVRMSIGGVLAKTWRTEGLNGFYRGFVPNALKNLPNKGVRLSTFDTAKKLLASSEVAYDEEVAKMQ